MAFQNLKNNMIQIVVLNFLIGISVPAIDNAAHVGGLIGGFIGAGIMSRSLNDEKRKKEFLPKLILGIIIMPLICLGVWESGIIQAKPAIKLAPIEDKLEDEGNIRINNLDALINLYFKNEITKDAFLNTLKDHQNFWTTQLKGLKSAEVPQDGVFYTRTEYLIKLSQNAFDYIQIAIDHVDDRLKMNEELKKFNSQIEAGNK